jgi:hypothetical protein
VSLLLTLMSTSEHTQIMRRPSHFDIVTIDTSSSEVGIIDLMPSGQFSGLFSYLLSADVNAFCLGASSFVGLNVLSGIGQRPFQPGDSLAGPEIGHFASAQAQVVGGSSLGGSGNRVTITNIHNNHTDPSSTSFRGSSPSAPGVGKCLCFVLSELLYSNLALTCIRRFHVPCVPIGTHSSESLRKRVGYICPYSSHQENWLPALVSGTSKQPTRI